MPSFNWNLTTQYQDQNKKRFHNAARKQLKLLVAELRLAPGSYDLRNNKGGIAVSGEITLHSDSIYIQVLQSCLGGGMGILIRTCKGRRDYTGGQNHWLPLSRLNDIAILADYVRRVHWNHVWEQTPTEYRSMLNDTRY